MENTDVSNVRNVAGYVFGTGSLTRLKELLSERKNRNEMSVIFFVDEYFRGYPSFVDRLPVEGRDQLEFVSTENEPTTDYINNLRDKLVGVGEKQVLAVVGIGGGITLDTSKAISNLLGNGGQAEDYQGWNPLRKPGIYKIGIPTISGTGAEATRTCVLINTNTDLKLGMNSEYTVFDQLILDPALTQTVPHNQYFYTGMDAYIHCVESKHGSYRNLIGDAYSDQCIQLCRKVFHSSDMMSDENRASLMVASYLGGCAIGASYVGVVHPFSAGLSTVLGLHHCVANCIALKALEEYYTDAHHEFVEMIEKQKVELPEKVCANISDLDYDRLYAATIVHEKPLVNALGENYKDILTYDKVTEIFSRM